MSSVHVACPASSYRSPSATIGARGAGLQSSSDSEVLALMLAAAEGATWEERLSEVMPRWQGAYSLVLISGGVGSAILGHFLQKDGEERFEGSELLQLDD